MRFPDASFDRALSMLVLPSVLPQPEAMVAEMRRVTRPGGVVAAAFWDLPGGSPSQRMLWDTAAAIDEAAAAARDRTMSRPVYAPGALPRMWAEAGLAEIDQRSLMIRMDFANFADYWEPFASGEGALGAYVASFDGAARDRLERSSPLRLPHRPPRRRALLHRGRPLLPRRGPALGVPAEGSFPVIPAEAGIQSGSAGAGRPGPPLPRGRQQKAAVFGRISLYAERV